jgi:hypothetical protein
MAIAARLRADDGTKNKHATAAAAAVVVVAEPSVVPATSRLGAATFTCVVLALVLLTCGTVWIGARAHALGRLRWRQSAADVDYLNIEIKSLESLHHHHVERW